MSDIHNPFDGSIPDPFDPEQMIEDPMHGPSAVHDLLEIPEMPLGDGTYYQAGGFYAVGTPYFDAKGQPIYRIGSARSTAALMREIHDLEEWRETNQLFGEEGLTRLEAGRQRERMDRTGVAHAFKPSDVCGGGRRLDECSTAGEMIQAAQEIIANANQPSMTGEGRRWNVPVRLGRTCTSCALNCEVAYQTNDGVPTGITRFTTTKPMDGIATIHIEPGRLRPAGDEAHGLREVFRRVQQLSEDEGQK